MLAKDKIKRSQYCKPRLESRRCEPDMSGVRHHISYLDIWRAFAFAFRPSIPPRDGKGRIRSKFTMIG